MHPYKKSPEKPREPGAPGFLGFPCFFASKKPGKSRKSKENLGFLGKPWVVFHEKSGEPGGNSWFSRKAWNLTTVGKARKAKKARNYQKFPGFHREAGLTDCCIAKNSQERQEWYLPKLKLPGLHGKAGLLNRCFAKKSQESLAWSFLVWKLPGFHRKAGVTNFCRAKNSQERQEWLFHILKLPGFHGKAGLTTGGPSSVHKLPLLSILFCRTNDLKTLYEKFDIVVKT